MDFLDPEVLLSKVGGAPQSAIALLGLLYLKKLVTSLEEISKSVVKLTSSFDLVETEQKNSKEKINDHEDRIRNLERSKP